MNSELEPAIVTFKTIYITAERVRLTRRSTSFMSDGTGEVPMDRLAEGGGRTKRVRGLVVGGRMVCFVEWPWLKTR